MFSTTSTNTLNRDVTKPSLFTFDQSTPVRQEGQFTINSRERRLLTIELTQPEQEILNNLNIRGLTRLKLISYYAEGLLSQAPLYIEFTSGLNGTTPVAGNKGSNRFALYMNNSPISSVLLQTPLHLTNNNIWYDTRNMSIRITNNQNLTNVGGVPIFSLLNLTFEWEQWIDPVRNDQFDQAVRAF